MEQAWLCRHPDGRTGGSDESGTAVSRGAAIDAVDTGAGTGLIFETEDSATRLTFEEVDQERPWRISKARNWSWQESLLAENRALPPNPRITLLLTADGQASGNSGVNSYSGSYKLLHKMASLSKGFATRGWPARPSLDLENSFLKSLSAVEVVHFKAGDVILKNKARSIVLEFALPLQRLRRSRSCNERSTRRHVPTFRDPTPIPEWKIWA